MRKFLLILVIFAVSISHISAHLQSKNIGFPIRPTGCSQGTCSIEQPHYKPHFKPWMVAIVGVIMMVKMGRIIGILNGCDSITGYLQASPVPPSPSLS